MVLPDLFVYSPFFALVYGAFAFLPLSAQALAWGALNSCVFWLGAFAWASNRKWNRWEWFGWIAAAIELNGSLLYQQANALWVGLFLLAIASLRDLHPVRAGFLLAISFGIKPLGGLFFLALALTAGLRFWRGFIAGSLVVFAAPFAAIGFERGWMVTVDWLRRVIDRVQQNRGQLDISGVWPGAFGNWAETFVFVIALGWLVWRLRYHPIPWERAIALGLAATLLTLPTAESPTFVLLAPAYGTLAVLSVNLRAPYSQVVIRVGLVLAVVFTTLVFTDLWPKQIVAFPHATKTLGAFFVFLTALIPEVKRETT